MMKYTKPNMRIEEWELDDVLTLVSQDDGSGGNVDAGGEGGDDDWGIEGEW